VLNYDRGSGQISAVSYQDNLLLDIWWDKQTGSNGSKTGRTRPSIFGGYDVFDKNCRRLQSCNPNIFGGDNCR
jgi:hypothetical protein